MAHLPRAAIFLGDGAGRRIPGPEGITVEAGVQETAVRRIAPNNFAIAFSLAGLGSLWLTAADAGRAPRAVGEALFLVAAVVWLALVLAYGAQVATRRGTMRSDLTHPVLSPFLTLATITPTILVAGGLHPGYFIPTVAGGLLASAAAAQVGQTGLAWVLFGYGAIAWLVIGSIILGRLFFGPRLPAALLPTLAIEIAPGAVASLAWFSLDGGRIDTVARLLAGYGVLMVVAQLRLLPAFLRLRFSGAFWAFAFSWTAVATVGLHWIRETRPAGGDLGVALVLAAATLLVGAIAVRTVVALYQGTLFPRDAVPAPPARHAGSFGPSS